MIRHSYNWKQIENHKKIKQNLKGKEPAKKANTWSKRCPQVNLYRKGNQTIDE